MNKTTLYLPDELHRGLRVAAKQSGKPQADLIRAALREYLGRLTRPTLASLGAGEDHDLAARDTEDWLEGEWATR